MSSKKDYQFTVNCPKCGNVLFKVDPSNTELVIKCSKCKSYIIVKLTDDGTVSTKTNCDSKSVNE